MTYVEWILFPFTQTLVSAYYLLFCCCDKTPWPKASWERVRFGPWCQTDESILVGSLGSKRQVWWWEREAKRSYQEAENKLEVGRTTNPKATPTDRLQLPKQCHQWRPRVQMPEPKGTSSFNPTQQESGIELGLPGVQGKKCTRQAILLVTWGDPNMHWFIF